MRAGAVPLFVGLCAAQLGGCGTVRETTAPETTLMLRGRIASDTLVLEPVHRVEATPVLPAATERRHRLVGTGRSGDVFFDLRFDGVPVADGPEEAHFTFAVPLTADRAERLYRVELRVEDGRSLSRTATRSEREIAAALEADDGMSVERLPDGRVRIRWDAARFPLVMVRDPETRRVLAFGRSGEAIVTTDGPALDITVSEGVQSVVRTVQVR